VRKSAGQIRRGSKSKITAVRFLIFGIVFFIFLTAITAFSSTPADASPGGNPGFERLKRNFGVNINIDKVLKKYKGLADIFARINQPSGPSSGRFSLPIHISVGLVCFLFIIAFTNTDAALIILIFSMLLSPEIRLGGVPERAVVLRIDDILIIVIFFGWLAKMAVNKGLGILRKTSLNPPIIVYMMIYLFSTGIGMMSGNLHPLKSLFYLLKYVEYFLIYFMVTNVVHTRGQVRTFIFVLLLTCSIICVYANVTLPHFGRATAPFEGRGDANTLGGYLVFLFAIVAGLFLYNRSLTQQVLLGGCGLLIFITLLNTLSRGSYLASLPMYFMFVLFSRRRKPFLVFLLMFSILLLPVIVPSKVIHRIKSTFITGYVYKGYIDKALSSPVPLDDSALARLVGTARVFKMWKKNPLLGYGATGVGFTDMQYALVLGEAGTLGIIAFFWLLISIFREVLKIFRKLQDELAGGLALGFLAGFIGLLVHSFSANTFIIIRIMEPFWFVTAILMVLPEIYAEEKEV
jgi:O-antigen ligase